MHTKRCRVVVLISGNGSNLQAIIDASSCSAYEVVAVISNKQDAYGLTRARQANIQTAVLDHKRFASRLEFDTALINIIDPLKPDLLVLAGFMRILSVEFVQHYAGKTLNIHPSLLPKFPGINTHQRAIDAKETEHGASVHFVTEELDGGPVVAHVKLAIADRENAEQLQARVAEQEHKLFPFVIDLFSKGRLKMEKQVALLDSKTLPLGGVQLSTVHNS
ncbi:MAG: phosphoribosylglycinamide formyltransferase [Pseudohongiellaceae bacterium]